MWRMSCLVTATVLLLGSADGLLADESGAAPLPPSPRAVAAAEGTEGTARDIGVAAKAVADELPPAPAAGEAKAPTPPESPKIYYMRNWFVPDYPQAPCVFGWWAADLQGSPLKVGEYQRRQVVALLGRRRPDYRRHADVGLHRDGDRQRGHASAGLVLWAGDDGRPRFSAIHPPPGS